ncbi:hypothetical protein COX18_06135 [Candidatus Desantisbacteria bacterium CG23_combo_of_CG06-09_8_20_14_all_40_23]|uniref:Uncharacterized protein n=1 Tax=Candidatus Desantisbacteria bacterium CG23_combo_of_CG06-09_8_20_14_all_40_23 TaxID=1974550 RepID=A0A2H0A819_9BACT|nr:MAG: hypothetical protein COX18_06135 [Candidatus Desantisbacteria bacterium CG23_combo_of_CG06-09_8_20_14_all_40_23]
MNPFYFWTRVHLIKLLGLKAKNQTELLEGIKNVPLSSIYYHTHRFLQQHHYLSPEPPNDFAYWLTDILNLEKLGEAIASVNVIDFKKLKDLRSAFIKILTDYLAQEKRMIDCPEGEEFHFMSCMTAILPTPYVASNLTEFVEILGKISINSLYFHIFEAPMRLEKGENDFSAWLGGIGEKELAQKISNLDPYTITLEGLRQKIIRMVKQYGKY